MLITPSEQVAVPVLLRIFNKDGKHRLRLAVKKLLVSYARSVVGTEDDDLFRIWSSYEYTRLGGDFIFDIEVLDVQEDRWYNSEARWNKDTPSKILIVNSEGETELRITPEGEWSHVD